MQIKRTGSAYSVEEGSPATGLLENSHKAVFQTPDQKLLCWQRQQESKLSWAMTSSMLLFDAVLWLVVQSLKVTVT